MAASDVVIPLARGGVVVRTGLGGVQFGAPPETIKDALGADLEVPSIFVLPSTWFSRLHGNVAVELEFPVYWNTFIHGRRVSVVCDEGARARVLAVLRESLFGPEPAEVDADADYDPAVPLDARADLVREMRWFRPMAADGDPLELDDVLDFAIFDGGGRASLGTGPDGEVIVERRAGGWRLLEGGRLLADLDEPPADLAAAPRPRPLVPPAFEPPRFGVTVLGSSHGFDPGGKTTGFCMWLQGRGVLVDPPCDATEVLAAAGVPPRRVDAVILTHCHADHDAGVFHKILEDRRVSLYTTPTILASFLRKYVAITGEPEDRLRRLFVYRPVTLGTPVGINGAEVRFFASLHAIPTIGFECFLGGKSLVYSADTLYDPVKIEAMRAAGVLGARRAAALLRFPWHHGLVIHEAGVPPIHTPIEQLAAMPDDVKRRLRIIHVAESAIPAGSGLKLARTGFEHTLSLPSEQPPHAEALEALGALAAIELFRGLTLERTREFLYIARRASFSPGALVIGAGEPGDCFYVVMDGEAAVVKDGVIVKTYRHGDFFGETALVTGAPRSADVRARTALTVLAVDKHDFLAFLRDSDLADALVRLARNRDLPSWDLLVANSVFGALTEAQRTQVQAQLEPIDVAAGETLAPGDGWFLDGASAELVFDGEPVLLGRGAFIGADGDVAGEGPGGAGGSARVRVGGRVFRLPGAALAQLLEHNPRLLLSLEGVRYVE